MGCGVTVPYIIFHNDWRRIQVLVHSSGGSQLLTTLSISQVHRFCGGATSTLHPGYEALPSLQATQQRLFILPLPSTHDVLYIYL